MKSFIETPVFQILCTIFDLVVLNLLYVLFCLPVVTIGAATTALYAALLALLQDEAHVYTQFLRAFRCCFRKSTVCWLLMLLLAAVCCVDFVIIAVYWATSGKYVALGLLLSVLLLLLCTGSYLFPLLLGSQNIKQSLRIAFPLSIRHLPRTLLVCVINILPLLLLLFYTYGFLILFWLFLLIGFSLGAYVNCLFLKNILAPFLSENSSH